MTLLKSRSINFILFLVILIWCIGIFWELVVHLTHQGIIALPFLKYNYSIVCHTDPDKVFTFGNFKSLTCSRCTGIYLGGLFSSIIVLLGFKKNVSTKLLILSSIPMLLDVILGSWKIYNYNIYQALVTGILLGSCGFLYIQSSFSKLK